MFEYQYAECDCKMFTSSELTLSVIFMFYKYLVNKYFFGRGKF